jgi:hypothetical protein
VLKTQICVTRPQCANHLNAELNPIAHLLALLRAHHILHVSRMRVKIRSGHSSNKSLVGGRNFPAIVVLYMRPLISEKIKQGWGKNKKLGIFLLLSLKASYQLLNVFDYRRGQSHFEYTEEELYKLATGRV